MDLRLKSVTDASGGTWEPEPAKNNIASPHLSKLLLKVGFQPVDLDFTKLDNKKAYTPKKYMEHCCWEFVLPHNITSLMSHHFNFTRVGTLNTDICQWEEFLNESSRIRQKLSTTTSP